MCTFPLSNSVCLEEDLFPGKFPGSATSEAPKSKTKNKRKKLKKALWWFTFCLCKDEDVTDEAICIALDKPTSQSEGGEVHTDEATVLQEDGEVLSLSGSSLLWEEPVSSSAAVGHETLVYRDDEDSEVPSSIQGTTCTADGEEQNLSSPSESLSDNQASQSLGDSDEGDSEFPSWCVRNLLRVDHTEDPSAATSEPVSPPAAIGHQGADGDGGVETCSSESLPSFSTTSAPREQTTLVVSNEEESEIPSSHLNFLFITSFNAGRGEEDTLSSIIESFSDQQASLVSTDDEESAISSSHLNFLFVTSFHAEAAVDHPGSGDGEDNLSSSSESVSDNQSIRPEVQMDWDMGDMSPISPKNSFQKIFRYVAPRRRLENGRNLLSTDELACHGLPNLSQTCYMNSVLQSLLTLTPFVEELNKQSQLWCLHPRALLFILLAEVNTCLTTKNRTRKKWTLFMFLSTVAVCHSEFEDDDQQDAHEFLNTVLQQLSSISRELKSVADEKKLTYTCPVEAHIRFQMLNTRHCKSCGHKSEMTEEYLNLSLVPEDTVNQGVLEYLKEEQLDYKCDCGASESTQQRSFSTLPSVLIIHLQRFEVTPCFTVEKTHKAISLSTELLLHTNQSSEKMKYSLKSIVNHFGNGVKSGHYVCDGVYRNASQEDGNPCWVTYDDDVVKETTFKHVCQRRQTTAYLLYYEKQRKKESTISTAGS